MRDLPTVSVVIPTYNRKEMLRATLLTIIKQSYPDDLFEVVIVDDGSTDGTEAVVRGSYPFSLRYLRQSNQGDAAARNLGVRDSTQEMLVFLDDDILIDSNYLVNLIRGHDFEQRNRIVVGTEKPWGKASSLLGKNGRSISPGLPAVSQPSDEYLEIPFATVCSNNMSVWRESYYDIGLMQSLDFPGSSIWCDVDFAYRGYLQGYEFLQSSSAICWHRDYVTQNLETHSKRMYEVAYRSVSLFDKYPDLPEHIPMMEDKMPISWSNDSPRLIASKALRSIPSSKTAIWGLTKLFEGLSIAGASPVFLSPLKRWIIGGYLYQGYRAGLRDLA